MKSRLFSALKKRTRRQNSKLRRETGWRRRLTLETLEDRRLLAVVSPPLEYSIEAINIEQNAFNSGAAVVRPPDPHGAIGPNHVLDVVNTSIQWFKKPDVAGGPAIPQVHESLTNFFASLNPTPRAIITDPKALYDPYAGRFVVEVLEVSDMSQGGIVDMSRILLAVSQKDDPNGVWYYTSINTTVNVLTTTTVNGVTTTTTTPCWTDYPGFALDKGAIYVTGNLFAFAPTVIGAGVGNGNRLWIIDKGFGKGGFYDGGTASVVWDTSTGRQEPWDVSGRTKLPLKLGTGNLAPTFRNLQPAVVLANKADGSDAPLGTWLSAYDGDTDGKFEYVSVISVENPLVAPKFTLTRVNVGDIDSPDLAAAGGPGAFPITGAPQPNTLARLDVNDRRTLSAVWRNNSLYVTTEVYPASGPDINQVTAYWLRFNATAANPATVTLADQGSAGGEELGFAVHTYMPSVAVDYQDNMVLGFAASGPTLYAGAYYALRAKADAPKTLRNAGTLAAGLDRYALDGLVSRWGDYTFVGVDPTDQVTFWVFNEYALPQQGTLGRWGTRWGSFSFATPAPLQPVVTTISGVVYDDSADEDGVYRPELGERPLANRQVYLDLDKDGYYDLTEPSVTTDDMGAFAFNQQLAAGTYFLQEAIPQGWHLTQPALPYTYYTITVASDNKITVVPSGTTIGQTTTTGQTVVLNFGNSNKNSFNWGTAPWLPNTLAPYPTTAAQNGASHLVVTGFGLGVSPVVTGSADGVPTINAKGDGDDGVVLDPTTMPLSPGKTSIFKVTVATGGRPAGRFYGWIDYNRDGDWNDPGEQVFFGTTLIAGVTPLNVTVPASAKPGLTYARFRYTSDLDVRYDGPASNGEVEDYALEILSVTPVAVPDKFPPQSPTVYQNTFNNPLDVLLNDIPSVAGRQALQITSVSGDPQRVTIDPSGKLIYYTPITGSLAAETFIYWIKDTSNPNPATNWSKATVTVNVQIPELPVTAVDDSFTLSSSTARVPLDVLKNDFPTGSITIASVDKTGTSGTIAVVNQVVLYTPRPGATGPDRFSYTVTDAQNSTSTAKVTVHLPGETSHDKMTFSLVAADMDGNPLPTLDGTPNTNPQVGQGQLFQMQVWVQDMRNQTGYFPQSGLLPSDQGVFSAYADMLYDSSQVSFNGTVAFGPLFGGPSYNPVSGPGQSYDADTPGLINEFGAFQGGFDPVPFSDKRLLFSSTYKATAPTLGVNGVVTTEFKTDPADVPQHQVVLIKPPSVPVPYTDVEYATLKVDINPVKELAQIRLLTTDGDGNMISQVTAGQEFWLEAKVSDLSPSNLGVYSAYLNISYDATAAEFFEVLPAVNPLKFEITWGPYFTAGPTDTVGVGRSGEAIAGFISKVGATQVKTDSSIIFVGEQTLFQIHFKALSSGELFFDASADLTPKDDVTLVGRDAEVDPSQVKYVDTSIIVTGGAGEGEYTNPTNPFDVNGDSYVSPIDALLLVNFLNKFGTFTLPAAEGEASSHYYFDVNHDHMVSAVDVLSVINCLNSDGGGEGEAPHSAFFAVASPVAPLTPDAGRRSSVVTSGPVASAGTTSGTSPSLPAADRATGALAGAYEESSLKRLAADQADLDAILSDGFAEDIMGGWSKPENSTGLGVL